MRRHGTALLVLALLSGVFGINYEVVYYRLITARFGDMLHVQAGVLAMFLLGIAVGARASSRLRRLWLLEILVGITAIGIGWGLVLLEGMAWLSWVFERPLAATALCMLLVAPPAILIGCSVPLFTEYLATETGTGDAPFRRVYSVYNLGAAASVLATEYLLVRSAGTQATLLGLALGSLTIGVALFLGFPEFRQPEEPAVEPSPPHLDHSAMAGLVLLGCASSLFQLVFTRAAMEVFGNTRGVFALSLALVLLGFPLGVRLARRFELPGVMLLATVSVVAGFLVLPELRGLHEGWTEAARQTPWVAAIGARVTWQMLLMVPLGLVPFACFGATLPIILKGARAPVPAVRLGMFLNGLGNALGFLLFIGLVNDHLSELGHLVVIIVMLQIGVLLMSRRSAPIRAAHRRTVPLVALSVGALILTFSQARYYGRYFRAEAEYRDDPRLSAPRTRAIHVVRKGGTYAGIIRFRDDSSGVSKRHFYSGHSSLLAVRRGEVNRAEVLSGVLPALFAPSLRRAAVVGIGTGTTAGTTARLFEQTDMVDINPAAIALLPWFSDANADVTRNPRAHIVYNDARIFLAGRQGQYDVVLNSVAAPALGAASKIYTTEFFHHAKRALVEGGVYMTWLSMNDLAVASIVESLRRSFRYCFATFLDPGYMMMSCADHRLRPRPASSLDLPEGIARALRQYAPGSQDVGAIVDGLHLTDDFLPTIWGGVPPNSDDLPVAEFSYENPLIPSTVLWKWPERNAGFVSRDLVSGHQLQGRQLWQRCSLYTIETLRAACDMKGWTDTAYVGAMVDATALPRPGTDLAERIRLLSARERSLSLALEHGLSGGGFERQRDSLAIVLAELAPDSAAFQRAAAEGLARSGTDPQLMKLRRYRAIALDPGFRRAAVPVAGGRAPRRRRRRAPPTMLPAIG